MGQSALVKNEQTVAPATVKPFGLKDKIGYMFGDCGNDFFFGLTSMYLMVYYTDVLHISAAAVGFLFLIARLWDAVADVTWGRFIDSRKPGKHGQFKPWILRMSIPLVISGVLMFVKIPGVSDGFHLAWAYATYILWGTLYSTVNIPYGAMASVITDKSDERISLSTWRSLGGNASYLFVGTLAPLIMFVDNKADENRFLIGAVIFALLALACYIACYKLSTERIAISAMQKEKLDFRKTARGLVKNKALLVLLLAALTLLVASMLQSAVTTYLLKDYFGSAKTLSLVFTIQMVAAFAVIPLITPLAKKFGKKETSGLSMLIGGALYAIIYFIPDVSLMTYLVITSIGFFALCFFQTAIWAFITDCIDYQELLTGTREDGTIYSIYSFFRKVGQAIAGGLGGFTLAAVGYVSTNEVQSQRTLDGIFTLNTMGIGAAYFLVGLIILFLYPLTKQRTEQLTIDLAKRRSKAN